MTTVQPPRPTRASPSRPCRWTWQGVQIVSAVNAGEESVLHGQICDENPQQSYQLQVNWGDGTCTADGELSGRNRGLHPHAHLSPGLFRTARRQLSSQLTLTDSDGVQATATTTAVVYKRVELVLLGWAVERHRRRLCLLRRRNRGARVWNDGYREFWGRLAVGDLQHQRGRIHDPLAYVCDGRAELRGERPGQRPLRSLGHWQFRGQRDRSSDVTGRLHSPC